MNDILDPWHEYLIKFQEYIDQVLDDQRVDKEEKLRIIYASMSGLEAAATVIRLERTLH